MVSPMSEAPWPASMPRAALPPFPNRRWRPGERVWLYGWRGVDRQPAVVWAETYAGSRQLKVIIKLADRSMVRLPVGSPCISRRL